MDLSLSKYEIPQKTSKDIQDVRFVYRPLFFEDANMTESMKDKFDKAKNLTKETHLLDIRETRMEISIT